MKVLTTNKAFRPITIVLESEREVKLFKSAFEDAIRTYPNQNFYGDVFWSVDKELNK